MFLDSDYPGLNIRFSIDWRRIIPLKEVLLGALAFLLRSGSLSGLYLASNVDKCRFSRNGISARFLRLKKVSPVLFASMFLDRPLHSSGMTVMLSSWCQGDTACR